MHLNLRGTGVAVITPFTKEKEIDYSSLGEIIEYLIEGKVDYLVMLGTTGESVTLTTEEKHAILDFTVERVNKRLPIVAGFGGNDTTKVIKSIEAYSMRGIDAILSVAPAYNRPTQEGIFQHFKAINAAAPKPIILYNVPSRTSSNISAETTLRLANESDNIVAIKEASGDTAQIMQIIHSKPKDFQVISGDDLTTLPMISYGATGVISVIGNCLPHEFSEMVRSALSNNWEVAQKNHYKLMQLMHLLFQENNPGGVKAAMEAISLCKNELRLPMTPITEELYNSIREEMNSIKEK